MRLNVARERRRGLLKLHHFEHGAVGILEADHGRLTRLVRRNLGLRVEVHAFGPQRCIILPDVLAIEAGARDADVIQAIVGPALGPRVLPFNHVEMTAMGIVTQLHNHAPGAGLAWQPQHLLADNSTAALARPHDWTEPSRL